MSQQYLNIPSLDSKKEIYFKQNVPPTMQGTVGETVNQTVNQTMNDSYIANRVNASQDADPAVKAAATVGAWYGLSQAADWINPKFAGEYDKSLGGKIGKFGDRISNTKVGKFVGGLLDRWKATTDRWATKNKFVYSLKNHSTSPEWSLAKIPGRGMQGFLVADADQILNGFMKPIDGAQKLEQYGKSQEYINRYFEKALKGKSKFEQQMILARKELKLLHGNKNIIRKLVKAGDLAGLQNYASELKAKAFGFNSLAEFKAFVNTKTMIDDPAKVQQVFEKVAKEHPEWKYSAWRNKVGRNKAGGLFNKVRSHLFGRTVSMSEYANKFRIVNGQGATSRLGKFLTKASAWLMEGATCRFAGGKLVAIMQATILADTLIHTVKAPKKEKVSTFIERCVNDFSYFIAMTAGIILMHKAGGLKYIGLDKAGVTKYRNAVKKLNELNAAGKLTKQRHKELSKAINKKLLLKGTKNPFYKLLRTVGRIINVGNEQIKPYKSTDKWNLNLLRKIRPRNWFGVALRVAIPMFMVVPFIAKWTTKGSHAIFGKPTNSVLDEGKEEPAETQPAQDVPFNGVNQQAQAPQNDAKPQYMNPEDHKSDSNLIKMAANGQKPPQYSSSTTTTNNSTVVNNTLNSDPNKIVEPHRTYIPSPESMVQNNVDMSAYDKAMAKADMAEKYINDTLASMNG